MTVRDLTGRAVVVKLPNNNNNNYYRDNNMSNLNRYRLYLLYDMNLTSRHGNRNSGAGRDQRNRGSQQSSLPPLRFVGHADKKPDASGRVFALTQDQAANTSGTITGALFIFGRAVFVLFDTGATHSVISTKFASCFTMTPILLDHGKSNEDHFRFKSTLRRNTKSTSALCYRFYDRRSYMPSFQSRNFGLSKGGISGHIVSAEGNTKDPAKVEAITKWPDRRGIPDLHDASRKVLVCNSCTWENTSGNKQMWLADALSRKSLRILQASGSLMTESHSSPFSYHPGSQDYQNDLKPTLGGVIGIHVSRLVSGKVYRKLVEPGSSSVHLFDSHRQTSSERTIPTLRRYVTSFCFNGPGKLDELYSLVSYAYNNSWHASIKCAPFEMLYGRKCRAPICWDQVGEQFLRSEMIEVTNEKSPSPGKSLMKLRRRTRRVTPTNNAEHYKLSPTRFIVTVEILERVGEVSYRLALPPQLSHVHNVFHISLLRGYKYHHLHVVSYPFGQIREDLSYTEEPESILDRQVRVMRKKTIPFVKILWRNHPEREATWETEESIRTSYPHFLP
ncbi:putative nucleotidyltransferase, ribonuclease H [Tanacetum coccineum]